VTNTQANVRCSEIGIACNLAQRVHASPSRSCKRSGSPTRDGFRVAADDQLEALLGNPVARVIGQQWLPAETVQRLVDQPRDDVFRAFRIVSFPSWDMCTSSGPSAMRQKRARVNTSGNKVSWQTPMPPKT
jgi:hypothetical protein